MLFKQQGFKLVVVGIVVVVVGLASAQDGKKLTCIDGILGPNPETMKVIGSTCKDPAIWGTGPGLKNPNCDGLCISVALGYLDAEGKPNQDMYMKWIEAEFLPQNQEFAKNHMINCFEQFGSKIDLSDPTCEMVKKFDSCGWTMQPKLKC